MRLLLVYLLLFTACETPKYIRSFEGEVITFSIYIQDDRRVIRQAFKDINRLEFICLVEVPENGDIRIYEKHLENNMAGISYGEEIYLNSSMEWTDKLRYKVTLHEIGHSLGLGHSDSRRSIMYYKITEVDKMSKFDKDRLREMYR